MISEEIDWKAYEKLPVEEQYRIHYEQNAEALEKTYKQYEKIKNKEIEEKNKTIAKNNKIIAEKNKEIEEFISRVLKMHSICKISLKT